MCGHQAVFSKLNIVWLSSSIFAEKSSLKPTTSIINTNWERRVWCCLTAVQTSYCATHRRPIVSRNTRFLRANRRRIRPRWFFQPTKSWRQPFGTQHRFSSKGRLIIDDLIGPIRRRFEEKRTGFGQEKSAIPTRWYKVLMKFNELGNELPSHQPFSPVTIFGF